MGELKQPLIYSTMADMVTAVLMEGTISDIFCHVEHKTGNGIAPLREVFKKSVRINVF